MTENDFYGKMIEIVCKMQAETERMLAHDRELQALIEAHMNTQPKPLRAIEDGNV